MSDIFAIIQNGGKQYLVEPGLTVQLEKQAGNPDGSITFDQVLLVKNDTELEIGQPLVAGAKVVGKVLKQGRAPKVQIIKFKSKTGYRKHTSHRQPYVMVKIEAIKA